VSLAKVKSLDTNKLHVTGLIGTNSGIGNLRRRYTLTDSDLTGDLFLMIGNEYNEKQISRLYTGLMRDEVPTELMKTEDSLELRVYSHVSGGLVLGTAKWRSASFHLESPLVMEPIRYGDRDFFEYETFEGPARLSYESCNSRKEHTRT
jgi:hypothetical protein